MTESSPNDQVLTMVSRRLLLVARGGCLELAVGEGVMKVREGRKVTQRRKSRMLVAKTARPVVKDLRRRVGW